MVEESPLAQPVSSDASSVCLIRKINVANNDDDQRHLRNSSSQQPSLTLSPPLPAIREASVNGSHETRFVQDQSLIHSPKKPKRSPSAENPTSFAVEFESDEERENFPEVDDSCIDDDASTETSRGNPGFVLVSDELLDFDSGNEFAALELEKTTLDFGRNEATADRVELDGFICRVDRQNVSNFDKLVDSCQNCSEKQSVEVELEKRGKNLEGNGSIIGFSAHVLENQSLATEVMDSLFNADHNCEVAEFEWEKSLKGDTLPCSQDTEPSDQTAVVDSSKIVATGASNRGPRKFVYCRKEIEALRFVNAKAQKNFWQQVRNGLDKTVKKEYDELASSKKHQKHVNRHQNADMRSSNAQRIFGELSSKYPSCDAGTISSVDLTCDASNNEDVNDLEEEWGEQEESDDEYESIQRPAFLVEGEPDFESGPPEDGLEYLRRVRWEASHIPKVKVAKIDDSKLKREQSVYMPRIPDIEKCPPHLAPSKQWEDEFIADFSELRLVLSCLDDTAYTTLCDSQSIIVGPSEHKSHSSNSWSFLESPKGGPTLSTILVMEPATRVAMLKRHISLFENASNLLRDDCAWLFALCAAVDTRLDADTCASLRSLLRRCAKLRAEKSELDDEVVMLNVLATICGKFFRQSEN